MAREIVTWCDIHLDKGEHITGQTWQFSVSEPGASKPRAYEVDVCGDCGPQLQALFNSVAEHARQVSGAKAPTTPAPSASAASAVPGPDDRSMTCPRCETVSVSDAALEQHLRDTHNSSIAEEAGTATVPCPLCTRKFKARTGLMAHIRTRHADYYAQHRSQLLMSA